MTAITTEINTGAAHIVATDSGQINLARPHEYDHTHADVSSGWLRAAVFGAMDGLVSNIGLITGVAAAGAAPAIIVLTGVSGLLAGGISMALGEYSSVKSANEQLDAEVKVEAEALKRNPVGEELELAEGFVQLGMSAATAKQAAREVHQNHDTALRVHLATEMGLTVGDRPSPWVAAFSSLLAFSVGAIVPLLPFLLGFGGIWAGLACGAAGLLATGGAAAFFARKRLLAGAVRQLFLGGLAVAVTFGIGKLFGVEMLG
ncbi:MAG: VIT1/CCC1 transporter family protein [Microbacteriaceae bacterium]|nr:VIT1/CCC1 transporter family protein [Microbacteriaceae bacterium]